MGISVVIPCFREPEILETLESLNKCSLPESQVEVIILINHPETATEEIQRYNNRTKTEIYDWTGRQAKEDITFYPAGPVALKKKWAGAGLARKYGMDEALRRFNILHNPRGIIVSLDADTLVEENYLVEIEKAFKQHPDMVGATIAFTHQNRGLPARHLQGIQLYESYMDYYKKALEYAGYPYPMFTVGSAFAVTAGAYVKRGGMNRRKAGEDFYFLQNLAQTGKVGEITATRVHPSARLSDRVPFGTGPVLRKWMEGEKDLNLTYNFQAFADLKDFFSKKKQLFHVSEKEYNTLITCFPEPVGAFLAQDDFKKEIDDLNRNCSGPATFCSRFFHKFNAFKILKFLNFTHGKFYSKGPMAEQKAKLFKAVIKQ